MNALPSPEVERDPAALLILRHHRATQASAALTVGHAAICGLELQALKSKKCHRGTFDKWLKEHLPEVSRRTAYRYLALAEGLRRKALGRAWKREPAKVRQYFCTAPHSLSDLDLANLLDWVAKAADGATLTELYEEFGILKRTAGTAAATSTPAGGYRPDPAKVADFLWAYRPEQPASTAYADLPPADQDAFRSWARQGDRQPPEQLALDLWTPVITHFEDADHLENLPRLPVPERERLLVHLQSAVDTLLASLGRSR